jgi:Fe-S cluster assembly protein SufD
MVSRFLGNGYMTYTKDWYIDLFKRFESKLNGEANSEFHKIRKEAIEAFNRMDFPSLKNEEWKYTTISPILKYGFLPANENQSIQLNKSQIEKFEITGLETNLIVLINGKFSFEFSNNKSLPEGTVITSLASAIKEHENLVREYFGKYLKQENGFIALNTAFANDGAFIFIPDNINLEKPIQIININGDEKESVLSQPRNIFISGRNSSATIIETHNSLSDNISFTNYISEIFVGENSNIQYIKIQNENSRSFHISRTQAEQKKHSIFTTYTVTTGGALVRNDNNILLNDEGCETHLFGLYLTNGSQHVDNHTLIDHAKPHCMSNELYKGVLNDKSHAVFNGKVFVRPDAQKTNAYQSNKNILLTKEASVDTKPQLEIYADDVRCTHGATVGQLDDESIFYLRSRGIPKEHARRILIRAFADDIFENISSEIIHEHIQKLIFEKLKL